jgi:hypothetical protein
VKTLLLWLMKQCPQTIWVELITIQTGFHKPDSKHPR